MSITSTLEYLLTQKDPFICLLKGRWGVGKTYFIKQLIQSRRDSVSLRRYSYVSAFGISTTEELLQSIFINSMPATTFGDTFADAFSRSSGQSLRDRAEYVLHRAKPLASRLTGLPIYGANLFRGFVFGSMASFFNKRLLIVLDDLERHSDALLIRDIMGVLTKLKEECGCQIIIVMNEDKITDTAYDEVKEKVVDIELTFEPTVDDAITIGLSSVADTETAFASCHKLKIDNIRTIQKIGRSLKQFRDFAKERGIILSNELEVQVQSTLTLGTWAYWENKIKIDDIEALGTGDTYRGLVGDTLSDDERRFYDLMREYGYSYSDDFDKLIIRLVKTGMINGAEISAQVDNFEAASARRLRNEKLEQAWTLFRGSYRPNDDEVVAALYDAHVAGIEEAQISSLDGAVWILRELGHADKADDLIRRFLAREAPIDSYDGYMFKEMLNDQTFIDQWEQHTERDDTDRRDLRTVVESYFSENHRDVEDIRRFAQFTVDEYYDFFKNSGIPNINVAAGGLARITRRIGGLEAEMAQIETTVKEALRRISGEHPLNELRLRSIFRNERQN